MLELAQARNFFDRFFDYWKYLFNVKYIVLILIEYCYLYPKILCNIYIFSFIYNWNTPNNGTGVWSHYGKIRRI